MYIDFHSKIDIICFFKEHDISYIVPEDKLNSGHSFCFIWISQAISIISCQNQVWLKVVLQKHEILQHMFQIFAIGKIFNLSVTCLLLKKKSTLIQTIVVLSIILFSFLLLKETKDLMLHDFNYSFIPRNYKIGKVFYQKDVKKKRKT